MLKLLRENLFLLVTAYVVVLIQLAIFSHFMDFEANFILASICVSSVLLEFEFNFIFLAFLALVMQSFVYDSQFLWYLPGLALLLKLIYTDEIKNPLWLTILYSVILTLIINLFDSSSLAYSAKLWKTVPANIVLASVLYLVTNYFYANKPRR
ncbi:MAG: hypothetical protein MK033_05385 [Candidatus Caenarcaniphilales bacterium]|nr:hypothetical protein [Candidatus Caenarcaniphilales bacterium]